MSNQANFDAFLERNEGAVAQAEAAVDALGTIDAQAIAIQRAEEEGAKVVAAGRARLEAERQAGVKAVLDVNESAIKVAKEYAEQLEAERDKFILLAREARADAERAFTAIQTKYAQAVDAVRSAQTMREAIREQIASYAEGQPYAEDIVNQVLSLEDELAEELSTFAETLKGIGEEIASDIKDAALALYESTLEPVVEWFQQEIVTPLFGDEPGVITGIKEWAVRNAQQFAKLAQVASIYLAAGRLLVGLFKASGANVEYETCKDNDLGGDFDFQYSRWNLLMMATAVGGKNGYRLPVYDRVFRFRRFQPVLATLTAQVGQCNPFAGGLGTRTEDCPGWFTGDFERSVTYMWHFVGSTNQRMLAEIWTEMGWQEDLPRDCDGNLANERNLWPSDAEYDARYALTPQGRPALFEPEGWPRLNTVYGQRMGVATTVPYPSGTAAPYVGDDPRNTQGQLLPEIPMSYIQYVPLLYLAFWFAANRRSRPFSTTGHARALLRAYEKVVLDAQRNRGYTVQGFVYREGGDYQPNGGAAWGGLRKIDMIPLLMDGPLTSYNFMSSRGGGAKKSILDAFDVLGMADEGGEPSSALTGPAYSSIIGRVSKNRGTESLVTSRAIQKQKSPLIEVSIVWAKAILSGSPEASGRAKALAEKVASGQGTEDDGKMLNALQMALYGPDRRVTTAGYRWPVVE